jgi:TonB family protein
MRRGLVSLFFLLAASCDYSDGSAAADKSPQPSPVTSQTANPIDDASPREKGVPAHTKCGERPRVTSSGILLPQALTRVEPDISKCVGQRGSGNPVLEAVIDRTGHVRSVRAISDSPDCVTEAALAAVKQWTFCPAEKDGQTLEMTMHLTINVNYH